MEILRNDKKDVEFVGFYNKAFDADVTDDISTTKNENNRFSSGNSIDKTHNRYSQSLNRYPLNKSIDEPHNRYSQTVKERGLLKNLYESVTKANNKLNKDSENQKEETNNFPSLDFVSINLNKDNQLEIIKIDDKNTKSKSYLKSNIIDNFNKTNKIESTFQAHTNKAFDYSSEDIGYPAAEQRESGSNNESNNPAETSGSPEPGQNSEGRNDPEIYEDKAILWPQIFGAVSSATVHLAVGCVVGFTGVTLPSLMDPQSSDIVLNKDQASFFSSIVNIGAIAGSILSSLMMTWLGQRTTLLVYLPIGMAFWISMSYAQSFWLLILSRIIQGIVIGVCAGCANNYVVETVHKNVRGRLFALIDLCRQMGFMFMYVVGSSGLTWRIVGLICGLTSMALPFIGMIFLPHSPRWLSLYGRTEEARNSLLFFRGKNYNVEAELKEIEEQIEKSSKGATVFDQLKMMTERSIAFRLFILGILLFASHFTGNFALIAYSVSIFESAEVRMDPYVSTIIVAFSRIFGVILYMTIADKIKRRPLLMIPLFLSGICMIALGSFFYVKTLTNDMDFISWLPLASVIFYVIFTMMSHPVLMLLRSELLPTSVRSVGVGLLYLAFFAGTFGVSLSYPYMVDSVGSHWTFWLYGATSFAMVLVIAVTIPETQGKSLEDIDELFAKKKKKNVT